MAVEIHPSFSSQVCKILLWQYEDKLGKGGYGKVYKGNLSDEIFVAIKVLNNAKENEEEFINEVGTIGRILHVNVNQWFEPTILNMLLRLVVLRQTYWASVVIGLGQPSALLKN
ncbi:hypothetical protein LguiB_005737 [Lonicera macranthoides]